MAKKINLAERISEMVNDDAARTYIREHTLYPAVLLSGKRIGDEEKVRYRCAHCRHEWEETRSSSHWYHENHIVCPKCHATMFKGTKIPDENEGKAFYHLMLWNGMRVETAYRIVYVNEAELDGTPGLIIAKYIPEVIDEPAASIVREIFELRRNGKSVRSIMQLMDEKYPTPRQYLYEKGVLHQCRENSHWDINAIIRTLNNRTYLGHMLSGKTVSRLYQGKKKAYISENQWDVVENVNEPIVSQEVFDAVQKLMQAEGDRRRSFLGKSKNPENIFKGLIFCRECGRFMHRGRTKITATNIAWYFGCSGYRNHKDRACAHRRTIREEKLKDAVLTFIKNQVKLADELMVRITNHNAGLLRNNLSDDKSLQTRQLRERLERLNLLLRTSFESYISGVISEEDYLFNKSKYEAEIKSCEEHMDLVAVKEKTIDVEGVRRNPYIVSLKKFSRARVLTREMCIALIDRIEIDEENAITIYPKYRDEFSALYEMIEEKERENE